MWPDLTRRQASGLDCVVYRWPYDIAPVPSVHVGVAARGGGQVLACKAAECAGAISYGTSEQLALGGALCDERARDNARGTGGADVAQDRAGSGQDPESPVTPRGAPNPA